MSFTGALWPKWEHALNLDCIAGTPIKDIALHVLKVVPGLDLAFSGLLRIRQSAVCPISAQDYSYN